jgi:hypothetical protein
MSYDLQNTASGSANSDALLELQTNCTTLNSFRVPLKPIKFSQAGAEGTDARVGLGIYYFEMANRTDHSRD